MFRRDNHTKWFLHIFDQRYEVTGQFAMKHQIDEIVQKN